MKIYVAILFFGFTILTSCSGQNKSVDKTKIPINSLGDTVTELSNDIWYVFQATNGDFWFGSDTNGVYQYNGKTTIHFTTKDGLSSNRIRGIQEDNNSNIYFSTFEGICKFDGHTLTPLTPIKSNSASENWKLQPNDLWFSIIGKNGEQGPYRYDGENLYQLEFPKHYLEEDYFRRFPNNAWSPYEIYYIYKDSKGTMWFGTSNFGVCRYDGKSLSWLYEDHLTNAPNGGSFGIRSILEDKNGKYWICNTQYRYDIQPGIEIDNGEILIKYEKEEGITGIKSVDGIDYVYFLSIVEDGNGELWMATYNEGVFRYNGKELTHYKVTDGSKDITVFTIYKDKKGGLWLGTHENGAYKFNGENFEKFTL